MDNQPLKQEVEELEEQLRIKKEMLKSQGGFDKSNLFLPISILIAGFMIGGVVLYARSDSPKVAANNGAAIQQVAGGTEQAGGIVDVSADDDAVLGDPNAPITLIEFSDFQCPFCRKFYKETLPQIKKDYIPYR